LLACTNHESATMMPHNDKAWAGMPYEIWVEAATLAAVSPLASTCQYITLLMMVKQYPIPTCWQNYSLVCARLQLEHEHETQTIMGPPSKNSPWIRASQAAPWSTKVSMTPSENHEPGRSQSMGTQASRRWKPDRPRSNIKDKDKTTTMNLPPRSHTMKPEPQTLMHQFKTTFSKLL
jgi:hypothetical protein